ncbi:hypothetical protein SAMN05444287_0791 [Octadecabacter temperatus]|uniref:Uncharacterized protein n=1 Tax=Octadecabacter temperatus TaxID=1458307 RepID=A0A0K0Y3Z8_9RHOB|nr:hypothetical protein [Octadecabacter temperatus]AKS45693.1 hypothetical protein OSB_11370 [Octadecabacter temperatus]SIN98481.1 hypothetical protein SAMN05444287_0791 [Octadecabacter temperatus]
MIYRHERRGRRWGVALPLFGAWVAIFALWISLSAAWWIVVIAVAFTLPALWDVIRDTRTWVEVWPQRIVWGSALRSGETADIDHVRLDRKFDGGMKITLIHVGGTHTRLPPDVSPPVDAFQKALKDAGITAQRHPFSVF